jgi:GLPGLI family protein
MDILRRSTGSALFIAGALLFCGCGHDLLQRKVKEGVIEYALSFPEYDPNGLMANMLPEKTILAFTPEKQAAELSAGMGVFKTHMMANAEAREVDYHLSVMSKKLVSNLQPRDLHQFNAQSEPLTILYTDQVDTIAGYPCRKAVAIYPGLAQPEAELWYTDRIEMKDPNWFGPYSEVPGVLLRYEMVQHGMRMRLDATSVTPGPVDPERFTSKSEYQQVSPEVLYAELEEVLGTFSL